MAEKMGTSSSIFPYLFLVLSPEKRQRQHFHRFHVMFAGQERICDMREVTVVCEVTDKLSFSADARCT
jgi:hypothetical protein